MSGKYTAELSGHSWREGPIAEFDTIREARQWAEAYGTAADRCSIRDAQGREVGLHCRDTSGHGLRWFRAELGA